MEIKIIIIKNDANIVREFKGEKAAFDAWEYVNGLLPSLSELENTTTTSLGNETYVLVGKDEKIEIPQKKGLIEKIKKLITK